MAPILWAIFKLFAGVVIPESLQNMKPNGWVKLHRKINENIFLMKDNNAWLVFTKLLIIVNSKGEYGGGRNQLGELVNLNPRTLYDVLQRLKTQQVINIKSNKLYSVITICNWSKYQVLPNRQSNNEPTMSQQSANTLIRIENKNKESDQAFNEPVAKTSPGWLKARATAQSLKKKSV